MKSLLYSFLTFSLITSLISAEEKPRTWFLEDGRHFKASFDSLEKGKLFLKNESGKTASFPIDKFGIADRFYLHDFKEIPLEQLEGGDIFTPEQDVKLDSSVIKDAPTLRIRGEGHDLEFRAVQSPHFFFLYGKGVKVKPFAEILERVWYSHAYRTPRFIDKWGDRKRVLLIMKDSDKTYEEMETYFIESLQASVEAGKISEKTFKQKKFDWNAARGHHGLLLPQEYSDKHGLAGAADITLLDTDRDRLKVHLEGYTKHKWRSYFLPAIGVMRHNYDDESPEQKSSWFGVNALVLANEIRIVGQSIGGLGGKIDTKSLSFRGFGESQEWGKDYAELVDNGEVSPTFDFFYNPTSFDPEKTTREKVDQYGMGLITAGRFLEKDLKNMIARARLCEHMTKTRKFPTHEELATLYGYESTEALDAALHSFAQKDNAKLKP